MKDFFIQCIKDLESLTGLRQLFFLQSDMEDGERKKNVLIDGMVAVSAKFDYIPQEAQQKIIRRMMIEDQQYDSLNSRTVHKWLDMHKDKFYTMPKITEEELTPAPPEVAEKYQKQLLASLAQIGTGLPTMSEVKDHLKNLKRVDTGRQKFVIEGIEIYAMNQAEAQKAFDATFK